MHNLFRNVNILRVSTEIAAGAAVSYSNIVDTLGFGGLAFVVGFGTETTAATNGIHAEMAATTATTDMVDVEDSGTTGGGDALGSALGGVAVLDLGRPFKRYYRAATDRATANSVITGVYAFLYNPVQAAVTFSTGSTAQILGSQFMYYATTGASTGS